ncbi:MAG: M23 family metallopeptidase [Gammaproteobacteria bacterium]|nr:MAG: M23 family metallopeptidase [Gammaproteobacteria bacterium]
MHLPAGYWCRSRQGKCRLEWGSKEIREQPMASSTLGDRRPAWFRAVARPRTLAAGAGVLLLLGAAFITGSVWSLNRDPAANSVDRWTEELAGQRAELDATRSRVDAQVTALATRVGRMQAQLMRLDALGRQLTEMARLDRGEFDFDGPPAVGGPLAEQAGSGPVVPALQDLLDSVGDTINDRQRQLLALQNLILARELARQVVPGGRPVESGYVSSTYGQRTDPFHGQNTFHSGVDFAAAPGTRVLAAADGIVSLANRDGGYGRIVEITHGSGYLTRYAHNSSLLVRPGQTVRRGDPIALMGSSGRATGTHLHFEVLRDGRAVNPLSFVQR